MEGGKNVKKRIICFALALVFCAGLSAPALAEGGASAGGEISTYVKEDGTLWACGLGELVDGSISYG